MYDYLKSVLDLLEQQYHAMSYALPMPVQVEIKLGRSSGFWFRYERQTDQLLCFLKGVKLVSTLNAALVLLRSGFVQEVGTLCRVADDCTADILFLLQPQDGTKANADQERFFNEFFQEEFEDPSSILDSGQPRDNVSRRKVFASFGRLVQESLNPSDAQNLVGIIHKALSGYVHGAYPHIMELYGGSPPHFHMSGMLGTQREIEWQKQFINELYRAIMISEIVAIKLGLDDVRQKVRELLVEYETRLAIKPHKNAETLVRELKQ